MPPAQSRSERRESTSDQLCRGKKCTEVCKKRMRERRQKWGPETGPREKLQRAPLRLRRRLDARVVLEELLVDICVLLPLGRELVVDEDRLHRTHRLARPAIDALVRVDVEHRLAF